MKLKLTDRQIRRIAKKFVDIDDYDDLDFTHEWDQKGQYYKQVVSPAELTRVLSILGDPLEKPKDWSEKDEWFVE